MHYKYVWRGLEEMFEFAHLHRKRLPREPFSVEISTWRRQVLYPLNPCRLRRHPLSGECGLRSRSGRWLRCFDFLPEISLTLRHGG